MKIKTKPQKPERRTIKFRHSIWSETSVQDILDAFANVDPSDIKFGSDGDYDGCYGHYFEASFLQDDESYQADLEKYERKLNEYNRWYKENEEEIKAEISKRKQQENKRIQKEQQRLLQQKKALLKQIEKLEAQVKNDG